MQLHGIAMPACEHAGQEGAGPATHRDGPARTEPDGGQPKVSDTGRVPKTTVTSAGRSRLHEPGGAQPGRWLAAAMLALAVLAAAAALVSYSAQYRLVLAAKSSDAVAALEAAIPDVSALIFATLGIALALHGQRAIRARFLNLGAVVTSVVMNVLAAGHGWRDLAIWVMPPVAYALASDTAIGVVRSWTLARQAELREAIADDGGTTPLAILGGLGLWLLRLLLAPVSTVSGFRRWVLKAGPVAPGRRAVQTRSTPSDPQIGAEPRKAITRRAASDRPSPRRRSETKTARFLALVISRHGPLDAFPLEAVSRVCAELASEVGLDTGAARSALRREVLTARAGRSS